MALKLVPFNPSWVNHDKIDIHAIYRRPRFIEDAYGERRRENDKDGLPTWDLTGPLPLRQHQRWLSKGFEYVTLANRESLLVAARFGTLPEGHPASMYDQHQTGGPWNWKKYSEGQEETQTLDVQQLHEDVMEFGSIAVTRMKRRMSGDPNYELPANLQGIQPRGTVASSDSRISATPPTPDAPVSAPSPAPKRKYKWKKHKRVPIDTPETTTGPSLNDHPEVES